MPAPYSDNLYSGLDSDPEDDHGDALSPTDGYFHAQDSSSSHETPYVPNVLVEDPTLRERAKEEEARYNTQAWDRSVEDGGSVMPGNSSERAESSRPALQQVPTDAPPAYSPRSPTSPTSPQPGPGYQTFASSSPQAHNMGTPDEGDHLLPREPQSMGGDPTPEQPGLSRWEAFKEEWKDAKWGTTRRKIRTVLSTLLVLAIIASLLGGLFSFGTDNSKDKKKMPGSKTPSHKPSTSHGDLKWDPLEQCHPNSNVAQHYQSTANLEFVPANKVSISQKINDHDHHVPSGRTPHISGNVVLRPVEDNSPGRMELEILSNHKDLTTSVDMNSKKQSLVLKTPKTVEWYEDGDPCIQIRITLHVPSGTTLDSLAVQVVHLDIDILSDLDLTLETKASLSSLAGDITAPSSPDESYTLSSREIWVETFSGDISGTYPLYDLLGLHTYSGSIKTAVDPQSISSSKPKPARLDVASVSGSLNVWELHATGAPARDYAVKFETTSGSIDAEVVVGSQGTFFSNSGSFKLRLRPMLEEGQEMRLDTDTKSGDTKLEIQEPTWIKEKHSKDTLPEGEQEEQPDGDPFLIIHPHSSTPFGTLQSRHSSISGSIDLRYPASWTGEFEAETISGSQKFRGEGLRTGSRLGMFPRVLRGWKGDGEARLRVDSVSGSQDFLVGKGY